MYVVCVCCDRYARVCCVRMCCMPLLVSSFLALIFILSHTVFIIQIHSFTHFLHSSFLFLFLITHNLFHPSPVIPVSLNILYSAFCYRSQKDKFCLSFHLHISLSLFSPVSSLLIFPVFVFSSLLLIFIL